MITFFEATDKLYRWLFSVSRTIINLSKLDELATPLEKQQALDL